MTISSIGLYGLQLAAVTCNRRQLVAIGLIFYKLLSSSSQVYPC